MNIYKKHINLMGFKATDKITGFKGVIDSMCFDLYGCIQASIKPIGMDKDGNARPSYWVDVTRLVIDKSSRVMDLPNFDHGYVAEGKKGAADRAGAKL